MLNQLYFSVVLLFSCFLKTSASLGETFLESLVQDLSSMPPSLVNYMNFIRSMRDNPAPKADQTASTALEGINPFEEGPLTFDIWMTLLYGCTVGVGLVLLPLGNEIDSIIQLTLLLFFDLPVSK